MDERMDAPNGGRIVELLRKAAMGGFEGSKNKVMDDLAQLIGCDGDMHFHTIDKLADMVEEAIQREHESAYDAGYDEGMAMANAKDAQAADNAPLTVSTQMVITSRQIVDGLTLPPKMPIVGHSSIKTDGLRLRRMQMQFTDEQQHYIDEHYQLLPKDADGERIHEHDNVDWRDHAGTWHKNALVVAVCSDGCYVMDGMVFHVHASDIRHRKHPTVEDVLEELLLEYDRDDSELTELIERFAAKLQLRGDE